jgi:hypothetical protein
MCRNEAHGPKGAEGNARQEPCDETFGLPATRRLALCDVPHIASPSLITTETTIAPGSSERTNGPT